MAYLPNPLGDNDQQQYGESTAADPSTALTSWVTSVVRRGREVRDEGREEMWKEYTRLWRGFWSAKDKNTNSERSKIVTPALSQAIDMTVAEMEEATFSRKA